MPSAFCFLKRLETEHALYSDEGRIISIIEVIFGRSSESIADSHAPGGSGTTTSVRVAPNERTQSIAGVAKERSESPEMAESQPAGIKKPVLIIGT